MAYVPGFKFDVFISYAHGDDDERLTEERKGWVTLLHDRLIGALRYRFGAAVEICFDKRNLRADVNFDNEIHDQLLSSAALLLIASPSYAGSTYCQKEREYFLRATESRHKKRFGNGDLVNSEFILKVVPLTNDQELHRRILPNLRLSDVPFYEGEGLNSRRFAIDSPQFAKSLASLESNISFLLAKMWNQCPPVFLWSQDTGFKSRLEKLQNNLTDHSFRIFPGPNDSRLEELEQSDFTVFLLGAKETDSLTKQLLNEVYRQKKKLIVLRPAGAPPLPEDLPEDTQVFENYAELNQELLAILSRPAQAPKAARLTTAVADLLSPVSSQFSDTSAMAVSQISMGFRRVYVVYDQNDADEVFNAGLVMGTIRNKKFVVDQPTQFSEHLRKIEDSDRVLLVWGKATRDWWAGNFADMSRLANGPQGVCCFDPKSPKSEVLDRLKEQGNLVVIEMFGSYEPDKLDPFLQKS